MLRLSAGAGKGPHLACSTQTMEPPSAQEPIPASDGVAISFDSTAVWGKSIEKNLQALFALEASHKQSKKKLT